MADEGSKAESTAAATAKPRVVRTHRDVAAEFGVSRNTVSKDWVQCGMPGHTGAYDLVEIATWKSKRPSEQQQSRRTEEENDASKRKHLAEARVKEAEADKKELMNGRLRSRFLERSEVESILSEMIVEARAQFERIPEQMKPQFPLKVRAELTAELRRRIDAVLTMMAEWRPSIDLVALEAVAGEDSD